MIMINERLLILILLLLFIIIEQMDSNSLRFFFNYMMHCKYIVIAIVN